MNQIKSILKNDKIVFGSLTILTFLIFGNTLTGPFHWDDFVIIVENAHVHSLRNLKEWFTTSATFGAGDLGSNLYRPLTSFLNAVIYSAFGQTPIAYRVVNILVHATSGYLVFKILQRLSFKDILAYIGAILFLVHPVQTESVSYIAGLADTLSGCLTLGTVALFLSLPYTNKSVILISIGFICALLAKEIGVVTYPLIILLSLTLYKTQFKNSKHYLGKVISSLTIITATYITLKLTVLNFTGSLNLTVTENDYTRNIITRIITFLGDIPEYLRLVFFPKTLLFEKPFDFETTLLNPYAILGLTVLVVGLVMSYRSYKKSEIPYFSIGFIWFFFALGPVSGLTVSNATHAEHWLYIPLVGMIILTLLPLKKLDISKKEPLIIGLITLILLGLSMRTIYRNFDWIDPKRFYEKERVLNPLSPRLDAQLGWLEFKKGNYNRAITNFEKALQKDPTNSLFTVAHNLGNSYYKVGKYNEAVSAFIQSVEINPNYQKPYVMMYQIFYETGALNKAAAIQSLQLQFENTGNITHTDVENLKIALQQ